MKKICVQFTHGDCIEYESVDEAAREIEDPSDIASAHYLGDECTLALVFNIRENEREISQSEHEADERFMSGRG